MAVSKSIAAAGNATSDLVTLGATVVSATLMVKADNDGTPAAGDDIHVKLLISTGDPDADADTTDEFTTVLHAAVRKILETDLEDPAISGPIAIPLPLSSDFKVYCTNESAGRAITVSAQVVEQSVAGVKTETQVTWS
jgi:hypothetical protein